MTHDHEKYGNSVLLYSIVTVNIEWRRDQKKYYFSIVAYSIAYDKTHAQFSYTAY